MDSRAPSTRCPESRPHGAPTGSPLIREGGPLRSVRHEASDRAGRWFGPARRRDWRCCSPRRCPGAASPRACLRWRRRAVDRVEPVSTLVVGRRLLLVLRVHLMQRRVDVQHHRRVATAHVAELPSIPWRAPRPSPPTRLRGRRVDLTERSTQRRVRHHRPEQRPMGASMLDNGARLAAAGEHPNRLHQHFAAVVQRAPSSADRVTR